MGLLQRSFSLPGPVAAFLIYTVYKHLNSAANLAIIATPVRNTAQYLFHRRDTRGIRGNIVGQRIDMAFCRITLSPAGLCKGAEGVLEAGNIVPAVGVKAVQEFPLAAVYVYGQHVAAASGVVDRRPSADASVPGQALGSGRQRQGGQNLLNQHRFPP